MSLSARLASVRAPCEALNPRSPTSPRARQPVAGLQADHALATLEKGTPVHGPFVTVRLRARYPYYVIMRRPSVAPAMLAALAPMSGCPAGQLGVARYNTEVRTNRNGRRLVPDRMPGTYGTARRGAIAVGMGPRRLRWAVQLEATRGSSCCTYQASPALTVCRCRSSSTVWWSVARSFSVSATKIPTYERWSLTTSITL